MNRPTFRTATLLLSALLLLSASARADEARATAAITFHGTSTLHDFEGTVTSRPFTVSFTETEDGGTVIAAAASVKVLEMNTENKKRDKNMFKMLDAKKHALISGTLENAVLPKAGKSEATLKLKIRNVEHQVKAVLSDWKRDGAKISCRMTFPVSLKMFELKAPSVLGVIRVGDTVNVECILEGTVQ